MEKITFLNKYNIIIKNKNKYLNKMCDFVIFSPFNVAKLYMLFKKYVLFPLSFFQFIKFLPDFIDIIKKPFVNLYS